MRIAIVSDIHGNLAAFGAVLRDLAAQHIDEVLVGGDLVLGGRQPDEVLDLLMQRAWPAVLGNTDAFVLAVANGDADRTNSDYAMAAWAVERLGARYMAYLRGLPTFVRLALPGGRSLLLVHATPWSIDDSVLPQCPVDAARRMMREGRADVVAYGHIHMPYHRTVNGGSLVSAGGVAWSKDGDTRPAYTILTVAQDVSVGVRRVAYDVAAELAAVERSGLPLSARLRWLIQSAGSLGRQET